MNKMKNTIESIGNWAEQIKERKSDLENRNIEIVNLQEGRELL